MLPAKKLDNSSPLYGYSPMYSEEMISRKKTSAKKRKRRRTLPDTVVIVLAALVCVCLGILYLGQNVQTMRLSIQLKDLEQEIRLVEQKNDHLQLALKSARSLETLELLARTQLGMVKPSEASVLVLAPSETQIPQGEGWIKGQERAEGLLGTFAVWLNKWFPLGGVEAGRIRH